jgi:surfeit locus 1 family protein
MLRLVVPTLAAIGVALSALLLGNWQLKRADEKIALKAQIDQAKAMPAITAELVNEQTHDKRRVQISGQWINERTLYIDNRTYKGQAGFHVITPLKMKDTTILVLRGWVVRDITDRSKLPRLNLITETVTLIGLSQADLIKSYELGKATKPAPEEKLWQSANIAQIAEWSGLVLAPFIIRQTESLKDADGRDITDGLVREWAALNTDVDKHRGYAFQWFSLAALSVGLWVWFVLVKRRK